MRALRLTSPLTHGEDVRRLQRALNAVHKEHPNVPRVDVDGQYGPVTDHRTRQIAFLLGIGKKHIEGPIQPRVQTLIVHPERRSTDQKRSSRKRFDAFRDSLQSVDRVLDWERSKVGVTESPANSNRGPEISKWQRDVAGIDAQPWCGAFQGYALRHVAGIAVGSGVVYTPTIIGYAKTGTGGFASWHSWADRKPGDLILFKWPGVSSAPCDHVGMLDGDRIHTIEGNTSSDNHGSQNNGGGVYRRDRGPAYVVGCARPRWK